MESCYVPGTVVGTGAAMVNKIDKAVAPLKFTF